MKRDFGIKKSFSFNKKKSMKSRLLSSGAVLVAIILVVSSIGLSVTIRQKAPSGSTAGYNDFETLIRCSNGNVYTATESGLQSAINDLNNEYGWVKLPACDITITQTINISSYGFSLIGSGSGYQAGGTHIIWGGSQNEFMINVSNCRYTNIDNICFFGDDRNASGIKIWSDNSPVCTEHTISKCNFFEMNLSILLDGGGYDNNYQVSGVTISDCIVGESNYGVKTESANADEIHIRDTYLNTGNYAIWLSPSGYVTLTNVCGGQTLVYIDDHYGKLYMENCQCEGTRFLLMNSSATSEKYNPITLVSCNVDVPFEIEDCNLAISKFNFIGCSFDDTIWCNETNSRFLSMNCAYNADVYLNNGGITWTSIMDHWWSGSLHKTGSVQHYHHDEYGDITIYDQSFNLTEADFMLPTSAPYTPETGSAWFNATTGDLGIYNGSNWIWK